MRFAKDILPAIGEPFSNEKIGIYAGITLHDNEAFALVLLPGELEGCWQDAMVGRRSRAASCPRASTCCSCSGRTLPGHVQERGVLVERADADDADWAWYQDFSYGDQDYRKDTSSGRARSAECPFNHSP
jgi:hypothetical protein